MVSDYLTGCLDAECTTIRLICYDRKLLHYVPVKGCSLNFLTSNEVQSKRIQICREKGYFECAKRKVIYAFAIVYQEWNLVRTIPYPAIGTMEAMTVLTSVGRAMSRNPRKYRLFSGKAASTSDAGTQYSERGL